MHSSNHTEHYRKWLYHLTCTKHDCTSGRWIFNWNTSINGHKQGTVAFAQRKPQSRSTVKSTFIFTLYNESTKAQLIDKLLYCSYMFRHYCVIFRELVVSTFISYISMWMQWVVDSSWNVMAHGDAREGKWKGNWRMEWVASTLHTTSEHGVSRITTADAHTWSG